MHNEQGMGAGQAHYGEGEGERGRHRRGTYLAGFLDEVAHVRARVACTQRANDPL